MIAAPGLDVPLELRARLADLYCAYGDAVDDGDLERWPDFFTANCLYKVMPRENFEQGLPIALIYCESRNMLVDRVVALRKTALGAAEVMRMDDPRGKIHHAEISIGGSRVMLADEHPEIQALSPKTIGGSPVSIHLYVEDVDAAVERAVTAGAKLIRPVADQFYGDRVGGIEDPFGYRWFIATHKEDLTMDEIRRRAAAQSS